MKDARGHGSAGNGGSPYISLLGGDMHDRGKMAAHQSGIVAAAKSWLGGIGARAAASRSARSAQSQNDWNPASWKNIG